MKTNLRTANLKEEYAETVLRERAAELGILLDDDAKAKAFRIQLKRKTTALAPFSDYDVWLMEGIRETEKHCEDCVLMLCMTVNLPPIPTETAYLIKKDPHGDSFRYRNLTLTRKNKGGKDFFVAK